MEINKQALREAAERGIKNGDLAVPVVPGLVITLLDELEAAEKRIAELREWNAGLAQESLERQQRIIELEQKCENDPRIHEIIDLKERIAELSKANGIKPLTEMDINALADDIVRNLVDTASADPEATERYMIWTRQRIANAAGIGIKGE